MAEFSGGPLTILFSDVEGSTDLRTERGDAAAHRILRSHEVVARRYVAVREKTYHVGQSKDRTDR